MNHGPGGVNWVSGSGIGIVIGGWRLSRATHTLASALCVVLHLREIPVEKAWCESVGLSDLSFRLYASSCCSHLALSPWFAAQGLPSVVFAFTRRFALCGCAMAAPAEGRFDGAEENPAEQSGAGSAAPASPMAATSELSSPGGSSSAVLEQKSPLLQKIKSLVETQKAPKEQKNKCAQEMKNAMKRKKRLQAKASQLSDTDLVEVLRMRKAKKESVQTADTTPPAEGPQQSL